MNKKAEELGNLILFITMILLAAIAAAIVVGVLINIQNNSSIDKNDTNVCGINETCDTSIDNTSIDVKTETDIVGQIFDYKGLPIGTYQVMLIEQGNNVSYALLELDGEYFRQILYTTNMTELEKFVETKCLSENNTEVYEINNCGYFEYEDE